MTASLRLHGRGKGDLYVVVAVRTPTDLTPRQRELLKEFKQTGGNQETGSRRVMTLRGKRWRKLKGHRR